MSASDASDTKPVDVASVSLSLGNLAAAQMMSGATTQAAAAATTDSGSGGSGTAGVGVDVLAMELRSQRSLVDILA
jgi:hypothetical protein